MEVVKLEQEHGVASSYIEEVPEEMEATTRFTGTINQKTGFRSGMKMTGLLKTGGLMKSLQGTIRQDDQNRTQAGFI